MKKNKKEVVNQPIATPEQNPVAPSTTAFPLSEMSPSEELQIYYNDAYMREKQRFNDMFGIIDEPQQNPFGPTSAPTASSVASAAAVENPFATPYADQNQAFDAQGSGKGKKEKKKKSAGFKIGIAVIVTLVVVAILIGICNTLLF